MQVPGGDDPAQAATGLYLEEAGTGFFIPVFRFFQPEPEFVNTYPVPVEPEPDFSEFNPVLARTGF